MNIQHVLPAALIAAVIVITLTMKSGGSSAPLEGVVGTVESPIHPTSESTLEAPKGDEARIVGKPAQDGAGDTDGGSPSDRSSDSSVNSSWEQAALLITALNSHGPSDSQRLRDKYLGWSSGGEVVEEIPCKDFLKEKGMEVTEFDVLRADEIASEHNWKIEELVSDADLLMKDAMEDFFGGQKYDKYRDDGRPIPKPRSIDGSRYWRNGRAVRGGWVCLLEFRSADYPALNDTLDELERLRAARYSAVLSYFDGLK